MASAMPIALAAIMSRMVTAALMTQMFMMSIRLLGRRHCLMQLLRCDIHRHV